MCLSVDGRFHPNERPIRTLRPLVVDKILERRSGALFSPLRGVEYAFGELYTSRFSYSSSVSRKNYGVPFIVNRGLHAIRYGKSHWTRDYGKVFPALIPAGSRVYIGLANDVVSDKLIVFNSKKALREYLGVSEFDTPIVLDVPGKSKTAIAEKIRLFGR